MSNIVLIRGSYGTLTVHRATGAVVGYDHEGNLEPDSGPKDGYRDIAFVHPGHLSLGEADILDVGFWTVDGVYIERLAWDPEQELWENFAGTLPDLTQGPRQ